MKSAVETLNPTRVKLTVEVPFEELKPSIDAALKEISANISLPGFRPGKVPLRLVEQRVGRAAVMQEAVNDALPKFYAQALDANDIRPLAQPEVDISQFPVGDGDAFAFTAEVDVRPEIVLPSYDTVEVTVDAVDDAAVEAEAQERMAALRERFGSLKPIERAAQDEDFVAIGLTAKIGEEEIDTVKGVSYQIGSGTMLPGLDEALIGLSAGESTTFTAPLAGGDRAGEDSQVTVTLEAVRERELPELDDDFAQQASEFDTLAELEEDLTKQARSAKTFEQGVQARDRVLEALLALIDIPLPQAVIDHEVHHHLEGEERLDDDTHRAEVQESTSAALRNELLLDAIAEKEQVQVSQQDLMEYLLISAQQYGMDPNTFAQALDRQGQVPAMVAEVGRRKALASVLEQVKVLDTNGEPVDLQTMVEVEDGLPEAFFEEGDDDLFDEVDELDGDDDLIEFEEVEIVETIVATDEADETDAAADVETADAAADEEQAEPAAKKPTA